MKRTFKGTQIPKCYPQFWVEPLHDLGQINPRRWRNPWLWAAQRNLPNRFSRLFLSLVQGASLTQGRVLESLQRAGQGWGARGQGWPGPMALRALPLPSRPAPARPRAWVQGGGADGALRLELRNTAILEPASRPSGEQRLLL